MFGLYFGRYFGGYFGDATTPTGILVPSVIGLTISQAQALLQGLGFAVQYRTEFSDTVDREVVMQQTPSAGGYLDAGVAVSLVVSAGERVVAAPSYWAAKRKRYEEVV